MLPLIRGAIIAAVLAASAALPTQGSAHVTFETAQAQPGSSYKAVLRVPHGCKGKATHTVRITIPEGLFGAKPMPKPGWTLTIRKGRYAKTYDYFGRPLSEGPQEIVWSGGHLANEHYDEFVFSTQIDPDLPVGSKIYVPVVQECADASERWVEIPTAGQDPHALKNPAPAITLVAAAEVSRQSHAAVTYRIGDLVITAPWVRATPKGAPVAGGYLTITNNGNESWDRLIGGSFPHAERVEVHTMSMDGGVMRMRPLEQGLVIKPGQTIALKPGGMHLMFLDFEGHLKTGEQAKGTLVFDKAGSVEITYQIAPMGAPGPKMHH